MIAESRVEGDVDKILTIKVPVDSDRIFDASTFDNDRQVILVEGVGGMGKTSLALASSPGPNWGCNGGVVKDKLEIGPGAWA